MWNCSAKSFRFIMTEDRRKGRKRMPKSEKQKMKLLAIKDILYARTDEEHGITTKELIEELGKLDIKAERKSIYQDIQTLEDMGVDVVKQTKHPRGYYIASREFELAEVKMLVDIVQAARFLTPKKSRELIHKLEGLVSDHQAKQLQRNLLVTARPKTGNETIYYNVDAIHYGISSDRQISFQYCEWNAKKEFVPKRKGQRYVVSPCALLWDNENYYLVAYEKESGLMKNYRVDKMIHIEIEEEERVGREMLKAFNPAEYSRKAFGMFSGEEQTLSLKVKTSLIGVILDRLGKDITIRRMSEEEVEVRITVEVSPQFFGWLAGLGQGVKIIAPQQAQEQYMKYLQSIIGIYEGRD